MKLWKISFEMKTFWYAFMLSSVSNRHFNKLFNDACNLSKFMNKITCMHTEAIEENQTVYLFTVE